MKAQGGGEKPELSKKEKARLFQRTREFTSTRRQSQHQTLRELADRGKLGPKNRRHRIK